MIRIVKEMPWECGKGWWPLVEPVAAAIDSYNVAHPDAPIEISQIKQKNGGLRIYHHNAPDEIRRLIDDTVATAWRTCEKCGSQEGVTTNQTGYRRTLCPACHAGIRPRVEMLHNIKIQRNNRNKTTS